MRKLLLLLAIALLPVLCEAQTTVNLTVQDTAGTLWLGPWSVSLKPPPALPPGTGLTIISGGGSVAAQSGTLSSGTASISLPANANIAPQGSLWYFTVCFSTTGNCFSQLVTVSTSSPQSITITPPSPSSPSNPVISVSSSPACAASMTFVVQPVFITDFFVNLNCNVTSSTMSGSLSSGAEVVLTLTQDSVGGRTFSWPANFLNTPLANLAANTSVVATFQYCGPTGNGNACPANSWQNTDVGPAGSGGISSVAISPLTYGATFSGQKLFNCTWSSGSAIVTCPSGPFTSTAVDGGKVAFATTLTGGFTQYAQGGLSCPRTTILSVQSTTQATLNANCTSNSVANNPFFFGPDETTAMLAFSAAVGAACGTGILPSGLALINKAMFLISSSQCSTGGGSTRTGPQLIGQSGGQAGVTQFVIDPNFDFTTCTGGVGGTDCFFGSASGGTTPGSYNVERVTFTGLGANANTIASAHNMFEFQTSTSPRDFGAVGIDANNANLTCVVFSGNPMVAGPNFQADGCGAISLSVNGGNNQAPVVIIGESFFGDSIGGGGNTAIAHVSGFLVSQGVQWSSTSNQGYNVVVEGTGYWMSIGDGFFPGGHSGDAVVGCASGTAQEIHIVAAAGGLTTTAVSGNSLLLLNSGCVAHLQQTKISSTGTSGQAIQTVAGTSLFDDGGNSFASTVANSISGRLFGSSSITGTVQTAGNWSTPAGSGAGQWGTSPSVACPGTLGAKAGDSQTQFCTITVGSGTVGSNPILTITQPTAFLVAPNCNATMVAGTAALATFTSGVPTTTTASFTYQGTPAASSTIGLKVTCQ
jgi:hypothetical protein